MKRNFFKSGALALLALMGMAGTSHSAYIPVNSGQKVSATTPTVSMPTTQSKKQILGGGWNPYKTYKKGFRNQRQYRKMLRSNPCLLRSKKCRTKRM